MGEGVKDIALTHLDTANILRTEHNTAHLLVSLDAFYNIAPLVLEVHITAVAQLLLSLQLLPVSHSMPLHSCTPRAASGQRSR